MFIYPINKLKDFLSKELCVKINISKLHSFKQKQRKKEKEKKKKKKKKRKEKNFGFKKNKIKL